MRVVQMGCGEGGCGEWLPNCGFGAVELADDAVQVLLL
jgi:hypothetical protein